MSDAVATRIIDQAGGNAFYLEELCRVVHEGGDQLPGTVLAMVQARLAGLDGEARRLLRAGAVFGDRFPRDGVLALGGDPGQGTAVDRMLTALVERELLDPVPAQIAGQSTYPFRHDLVREAAYATLTDRELGHRLAAEWSTPAGVTDSAVLAEHFARGGVPEKAVDGYLQAARDALEGNDMSAVLARVERGLACGARGEALGELLVLRAEAHRWRADYTSSIEAAQLAMAVLPPGTRGWCSASTQAIVAYCGLAEHEHLDDLLSRISSAPALDPIERVRALARGCVNLYLAGRYDRADQLLDRLEGEVERAGLTDEPLAMSRVLEARAFREGARAEQGRALALLERVLVEHERAGDLRSACLARNNLGYTFVQLGAYARAEVLLETTLRDAERMGQPFISVLAQQNLGVALAALGRHDRAVEVRQASVAEFDKQDDTHMAAVSRAYLAAERLRIGNAAGAAREAQLAADTPAHTPPSHALALAILAHALLTSGDHARAGAGAPGLLDPRVPRWPRRGRDAGAVGDGRRARSQRQARRSARGRGGRRRAPRDTRQQAPRRAARRLPRSSRRERRAPPARRAPGVTLNA